MDQLTEYKELKDVEKKIEQFNEQHGTCIMELTLKASRTPEETAALNLLNGQLSDLKKKEVHWSRCLDVAQQQLTPPAATNAHAAASINQGRYRDFLILSTNCV